MSDIKMIQSQPLVIKISTDKTQKVATLPQMRKKQYYSCGYYKTPDKSNLRDYRKTLAHSLRVHGLLWWRWHSGKASYFMYVTAGG